MVICKITTSKLVEIYKNIEIGKQYFSTLEPVQMFALKIVPFFLKCLLFCTWNVSNVNFYKYIELRERGP